MDSMACKAFLNIGISFAELSLASSSGKNNPQFTKRIYLAQESLSSGLKKTWQELGETPSQIILCSRYLERILDAKLGGSVAQIVTKGFETWPILRQPLNPAHFSVNPKRQDALASKDLIFGLSERISAKGQNLQSIELAELEFINSKLKLMSVKRVCINLLHSQAHREHQNQVAHYFREQGFEVFAAQRPSDSRDEMPAWRKNVINACLSGAFSELIEEIKKSCGDNACAISVIDSDGKEFLDDKNLIVSSLFSWSHLIKNKFVQDFDQVLYLGLEDWFLISTKKRSKFWESAWGLIEVDIPKIKKLGIQPTQEIVPSVWGGLAPGPTEIGFEPGPISFGRAHRATVFDVLCKEKNIELPYVQSSGVQRFSDQLTASIKNSPELHSLSVDQLVSHLYEHVMNNLHLELHFCEAPLSSKTVVTGFFAPYLFDKIKSQSSNKNLQLAPLAAEVNTDVMKGLNI